MKLEERFLNGADEISLCEGAIAVDAQARVVWLSDFLETLSDERVSSRRKLRSLLEVWARRPS